MNGEVPTAAATMQSATDNTAKSGSAAAAESTEKPLQAPSANGAIGSSGSRGKTTATKSAASGKVAFIAGSQRPQACGHRFGPELDCIECGQNWDEHQHAPTVCEPNPEQTVSADAGIDPLD